MENRKKFLPFLWCVLITAAAVFLITLMVCTVFFRADVEKVVAANTHSDPEYIEKVNEIVTLIDEKYIDTMDEQMLNDYLSKAAIAATGDRWSYYISAEEYDAYMEQNANAYVGIGITIQWMNKDDPGYTIVSVTSGSPAEEAGIKINDMVVAVEGNDVLELGITEARNLVRGEEGTEVSLTILRDGTEREFKVKRATIEVEVVAFELLEDDIGYIKINNFDTNCARDTLAAIESLLDDGADALIFDLRFNPGGMKREMVEILDYLLPEGPLFRSVNYRGEASTDMSDANCLDIPMAVIVNDRSYSAAEFFAAALQEYEAGVIVGTQTCGKANYQETFRLSDGSAVALSTGHYQTPNGVTLTDVGVTPDMVVEVDEETYLDIYYERLEKSEDAQLQAAISALRKQKS